MHVHSEIFLKIFFGSIVVVLLVLLESATLVDPNCAVKKFLIPVIRLLTDNPIDLLQDEIQSLIK
jgi:hypothetical protein